MSCETDCNAPWDRLLTNMIVQEQGSPQKPSTSIQKLIGHAHSSLSWTYSKNPLFGNLQTVSNSNMLVNIFLLILGICTISYKSVNNESATQRPIAMNRVTLNIPHTYSCIHELDTLPLPSINDQSKELNVGTYFLLLVEKTQPYKKLHQWDNITMSLTACDHIIELSAQILPYLQQLPWTSFVTTEL